MTAAAAPATPAPGRRPASLALQISLLAAAIVTIAVVIAGLLAAGLIRSADERSARQTLAKLADASAAAADLGVNPEVAQQRAFRTLRAIDVQVATVTQAGRVTSTDALARRSVTAAQVAQLEQTGSVSLQRTVAGQVLLVEGRRTNAGAIVLVQRRSDALAGTEGAIRRMIVALLVAAVIAVLLGLLVAYRIARPLRRTASAAHALAAGRRDVRIEPSGPAEVAEVAEALNGLAAELGHSEQRQREFLMSVSHDLRTPLTSISGYAESLADGIVTPEEVAGVGQVLVAESQRLDRLVGDLLDLARLGAQEFRIDLTEVDVRAVAASAAPVWAQRCAEAGVRFVAEVAPEGDCVVTTDPGRLRQALDGLFDNALRVTPPGAPIVLALRRESGPYGPQVVIEVRDGGPGLTDDDLAVAFDRSALYDRYRGVRRVGTGLGLAIVHGLVTRLGGGIAAGHAPEGGARFTVRLNALR